MIGQRLGPYDVLAKIGEGGMGEVYRARDTRLDRDVAIKVLPKGFVADPERIARFEREAKALATLNHPHIAQIYGVEESSGTRALVMELVEGETLADRLGRGAIPIEEVLPIARQIAEALEAAHDKGIVHRDLKPANIKLRPDGTVKVLDFGLAKAIEGSGRSGGSDRSSEDNALNSPTITSPAMTAAGLIIGTAAYMSPEQARGHAIDHRADVWAFGAILFELLSGHRPFAADTVSDTIAAVLTRHPDLGSLPAGTPAHVRRVLERCLQKDARRRFYAIADVRLDLEDAAGAPAEPHRQSRSRTVVALAAGAALGAAVAAMWILANRVLDAPSVRSFTIPGAGFNTVSQTAISPDGKWIAYSPAVDSGPFRLYVRALDSFDEREVAVGSTQLNPFFSPDSKWVAYFNENTLQKVLLAGGTPQRIATVSPGISAGVWGRDGFIVLSANLNLQGVLRRPLARVPADGGELALLLRPGEEESYLAPTILPDGRTVLATLVTPRTWSIVAVSIEGGERRVVLTDARTARFSPSGHLLFQRPSSGDLMAVRFDPTRLETLGDPVRLTAVAQVAESVAFSAADDGTLIYSGPSDTVEDSGFTIVSVDRTGAIAPVLSEPGSYSQPRASSNGRFLLYRVIGVPNCNVWMLDIIRGTRTRVTFDGDNHDPVWHPDGRAMWSSVLAAGRVMRIARVDRAVEPVAIAETSHQRMPHAWSRDGSKLLFVEINPVTGRDLWLLPTAGDARPIAASKFDEDQGAFSPDGRWIAYVSNESGRDEVYIQPIEGDGGRVPISVNGGTGPLWSPDGRELFYAERAQLMGVDIDVRGATPEVSRPRKLLEGPFVWDRVDNYDISPDGKRFFFIRRAAGPTFSATLRVVLNWTALPQVSAQLTR